MNTSSDNPVRAVESYPTNGHLIAAAARLGHLRYDWLTLDVTHECGVFWQVWHPARLVRSDLARETARRYAGRVRTHRLPVDVQADGRRLPFGDGRFDAVVVDPPYGLRGTVHRDNGGYGLDAGYMPSKVRHRMMCDLLVEAARVVRVGGRVLFKCQDQVCEGRVHWQTDLLTDQARMVGLRKVERLDMSGGRPQPARTRKDGRPSVQQHAYMRPSTLLIFEKEAH